MSRKIKVMSVFGTRPEAIKMAPVVKALEADKSGRIQSVVCVTAQHREMLDQVLGLFDIVPQHDLNLMKVGQTLPEITSGIITGISKVLEIEKPDLVLVHGDTTTTFSTALAAFYNGTGVGHVEAGLRSGDKYSPFPEEMNRVLTGRIAELHFSPTDGNIENLKNDNISIEHAYKTGNTVIDALISVIDKDYNFGGEHSVLNSIDYENKKVILLTSHRRENIGKPMENIFSAIRQVVEENEDIVLVFPIHKNPKVRELAAEFLGEHPRIHVIEPLDYKPFANLMARSYFVLTDSGGIQEEAPAVGKPVLVLRTETERPEAIEAGTVMMVGVEKENIINASNELIRNKEKYSQMANAVNPYGDGHAAERIVEHIKDYYKDKI